MARGGKLVFKGEEKAKKKKKKSKSSVGTIQEGTANHANGLGESIGESGIDNAHLDPPAAAHASSVPLPSITTGRGLISTSGTVATGHGGTSFKSDLRIGDAIIAQTQRGEEMRVVTMVLSQISISISSAFSSDLKTPTQYKFIVKPRDIKRENAEKARKAMAEKEEVETRAMGTYGNKGEIVYREKTEHGSYRIRREQTDVDMSRSDLLSMRAKKKSDRYC